MKSILVLLPRVTLALALGVAFAPAASAQTLLTKAPANFNDLVKAAKAEGELTVIACPHDWVNYGEIFQKFSAKYGIKLNELNPDGSSGEEIEAIKANKGNTGPQAPDVIDVGLSFGPDAKAQGLLQPYKVSTWATIPASLKQAQGFWTGDYWGVIAFGVNTSVVKTVPTSWAALQGSDFKNRVALNGDPRKAGAAFGGVYAASLANGGSVADIKPGISFFADLKKAGNLLPVDATPGTVATGQTPVTIDWSYLQRGYADQFKGKLNWKVQVPSGPAFANFYAQAINKTAPHPNAAKLWLEFLYSDQGQNLWMKGYAFAARYADMNKRKAIPAAILKNLPPADVVKRAKFATLAQIDAAKTVVGSQWGPQVAGN